VILEYADAAVRNQFITVYTIAWSILFLYDEVKIAKIRRRRKKSICFSQCCHEKFWNKVYFNHQQQTLGSDLFILVSVLRREKNKKEGNVEQQKE
jgi:hypothetical protein